MKRISKAAALILLSVMLCSVFTSCAKKLSGTYTAEVIGSGVELKFSRSNVTISIKALGSVVAEAEGKYSISDDKITLEFETDKENEDKVKTYNGTFDFAENENSIKIGLITYEKKKQ